MKYFFNCLGVFFAIALTGAPVELLPLPEATVVFSGETLPKEAASTLISGPGTHGSR